MAPLRARLKDARIVAMGEATHGTREFQQIKVQMFRYLVENLGFTVFGLETNWPESLAVNDYVLGGDVDPTAGLGFLWWQTEDMFALLRWMRQYNQDTAHTRKLKFYGFDMQIPGLAESNVRDYLRRVDPDSVDAAARVFEVRTAESLDVLLRRFDERKSEWVRRSSGQDWTRQGRTWRS
jgi:erythromycin esterase